VLPLKYSIRNVASRPTTTAMTVLAIALVTGVFVAISALAGGLRGSLGKTGDPATVLVLRPGAQSEAQSSLTEEAFRYVETVPGIARGADGAPVASGEVVVLLFLPREDGKKSNVTIRGVRAAGYAMRPSLRVVEGRAARPALRELVVGKRLAGRFPALRLGQDVRLGPSDYRVVGLFESGGSAEESEAIGDADAIRGDMQRDGLSCARLRVEAPATPEAVSRVADAVKQFRGTLSGKSDALDAKSEPDYYAGQQEAAGAILGLGGFISAILAVGAIFATMNTLYAAVAARAREIATLRALGFGRGSILGAVVVESLVLSLLGWALAIVACRLFLDGISTGTTNFATFSEIAFDFRVDPGVALAALVFTTVIGVAGGLFPAVRATRTPVSVALRQV
jgi:putative ABC transport system permease protein